MRKLPNETPRCFTCPEAPPAADRSPAGRDFRLTDLAAGERLVAGIKLGRQARPASGPSPQ